MGKHGHKDPVAQRITCLKKDIAGLNDLLILFKKVGNPGPNENAKESFFRISSSIGHVTGKYRQNWFWALQRQGYNRLPSRQELKLMIQPLHAELRRLKSICFFRKKTD